MGFLQILILCALASATFAAPARARDLERPSVSQPAHTEPPVPDGKLGDAAVPQAYRLDLTIDPSQPTFSGQVEIDVVLARPARLLDLHGRDLAMRRVAARAGGREIAGTWEQVHSTGVARIRFAEELPAGPVTFAFRYEAAFNEGPSGLFRVNVDGDWYSWSQFQSIDARAVFPSFDEPGFKTPFDVTLRTPPGAMAVSNAPEIAATLEGGLTVHRFEQTLPLPTYLVAMMVGPFAAVQGEVPPSLQRQSSLPLRVVSTRPNAGKLDFALEGSREIVLRLEDYFGEAFPYPKLDQITSPIMPGAMENAGADLYRDGLLVMDANAPVAQQRRFGMVVSHELGHQWFGDLVTPAWWDDIWLNESFANWIGYHIGDAWRPDLNIGAGALVEGFEAMETDALIAGRPIRQPITTNAQIDGAFDSITYGKGGHVIAMIASYMGDEKFRDGVRLHLARHRHSTATGDDFFRALAEAADDPGIVPAMQSFVEQQGVPLLAFQRKGHTYTISQYRYAPLGAEAAQRQWGIPLCVRSGRRNHCELMTDKSVSFRMEGIEPLVPNAGGTGYYRFELPKRHWNALIARANGLSGGEALAVVDSLQASIRAGRGNVSELARLARKLIRHPDSYAADAATDAMGALASSGIVDSPGRQGWRRFRARLYAPLLKKYGFDPRAGVYADEAPEQSQRRFQIVGKLVGTHRGGKIRRQLIEATRQYLDGDTNALDPVWFGHAFNLHVHLGGEVAASDLVAKALASEDPVFRPAALDAAAQSGDEQLAHWLLEDLDDIRLRQSERRGFMRGIMQREATMELGYRWMVENLEDLLAKGGIFLSTRLPQFVENFCSVQRAREIGQELRPRFAGTPGELELERAVERVHNCGVLNELRGAEISSGFARLR